MSAHRWPPGECRACDDYYVKVAIRYHPLSDVGPWDDACPGCGHIGGHATGVMGERCHVEETEAEALSLLSRSQEQRWWQAHVEPFRDGRCGGVELTTRFLSGRHRFGWPASRVVPEKGDRPPFGLVLLTWDRSVSSPLPGEEK